MARKTRKKRAARGRSKSGRTRGKPLYGRGDWERRKTIPEESSPREDRSDARRDFGRLIHSPSFRRLQGKTQLFPGAESDFFRNRLTHSLEVAQIARGIASHHK
jgi:dGTPase